MSTPTMIYADELTVSFSENCSRRTLQFYGCTYGRTWNRLFVTTRDGVEYELDNLYIINAEATVIHGDSAPEEMPEYASEATYHIGDVIVRVCHVNESRYDVFVDGVHYPVWHEPDDEGGGWHTEVDGERQGTWDAADDLLKEMFAVA